MLQTYIKGTEGIYICIDNPDVRPFFNSFKALCLPICTLPGMPSFYSFLAPSGAQGVTMTVCSSVRPVQTCLELSILIILAQVSLSSFS